MTLTAMHDVTPQVFQTIFIQLLITLFIDTNVFPVHNMKFFILWMLRKQRTKISTLAVQFWLYTIINFSRKIHSRCVAMTMFMCIL